MTDRTQFEAMLEALINEDQETAKEIFHNIVVAKSRDIYEELLAEDFSVEEEAEEEEESVEETYEEEESVEEDANPFADAEEEEEGEESEEGDATDDFSADAEGDESEEGDVEDRVMDLEDALEELKAEFEELMAGEEEEPEHADEFGGEEPELGGADDFTAEPEMDELAQFMEYVDKVALPKHGDNGANAKSVVAGKNDMGGTTANIARGGEAKGAGTAGGLLKPTTTVQDAGNVNKPGANAGKTAFKKKETASKAQDADNKKSIVGSRK